VRDEDFELISITGYETIDKALVEDCDAAAVSSLVCFGEWNGDTKGQITQEFRLSGATDSANWIAGAFYFADEKFATVVVPPFGGFGSYATTEATSWALFAQADFELTDTVTLVTGVRYTDEDRDLLDLAGVTGGVAGTKLGTPFFGPIADTISTEKITGKIGVQWKPALDVLGYASISTGFKSGIFNTVLLGAPEERGPVGEETVISYEIGAKTTWWDRRAKFNAAAFYYDYTDFQVSTVTLVGGVPVARFSNAGDVSIFGAELELTLIPSSNWEFRFGVGLLDTEIDAPLDLNIGGNLLNGNETPVSPAISLNGVVRYSREMSGGGTGTLQVDFNWKDDFFFGPDNDPFEHQDAFGLLNLRAFWTSPTGRYEASAFVENVLDEEYATFAFITGSFPGAYKVWGRPSWAGVRVGVNF
jgi:iron complex outermembrane receptor protein